MKIFRAIGLGIAIVLLKFLVPTIFLAGENTIINLFTTFDSVLLQAQSGINALL